MQKPIGSEIGKKYGRFTVLRVAPLDAQKRRRYIARCECGSERAYDWYQLKIGARKSCGCLRSSLLRAANIIHGESAGKNRAATPEYSCWRHMVDRCEKTGTKDWENYGGRGIKVCAAWRASYQIFLTYVGRRPSPGHSIGRINNDGNYEPGNVRWETRKEQASNRRDRKLRGACPRGHLFTEVNTYRKPNGERRCRNCQSLEPARRKR